MPRQKFVHQALSSHVCLSWIATPHAMTVVVRLESKGNLSGRPAEMCLGNVIIGCPFAWASMTHTAPETLQEVPRG